MTNISGKDHLHDGICRYYKNDMTDIGHNVAKQLINVILFLKMLSRLLPDTELVYLCSIWIIYI